MKQSMGEILAPAGGSEQLLAAVRCGAGAVYLGGKNFNARRNAANFDQADLNQAVAYCHGRGVRVYVTVNTVVMDSEMELLEEEARLVASSGADAVIIQDMAVLKLFTGRYPSIQRYASTQTAVHNIDGARFLQDAGFDSVVLARELTLREMEAICTAVPLKMEAFVHGAHCMSVSGACYLSSVLGGRSGNRGLCAQPCRLDWSCGPNSYALSLKDMSLLPHMRQMAEAGVDSFKIEGRMKRPEYVAAAVTACKNALAGKPYDAEALRAVFSRSGFTDGYLTGKRDGDMFGCRTKEDVAGAEGVLKALSGLYRNETPLVPVDMRFSMDPGGARLTVEDGVNAAEAASAQCQRALHRSLDEASAQKSLSKTGGTPFYVRSFRASIQDGLMLPASALNAMRRDALDALLGLRSRPTPHEARPYALQAPQRYISSRERPALWARFSRLEQLSHPEAYDKILLPLWQITQEAVAALGTRLVGELPAILFPDREEELDKQLEELVRMGLRELYADNIYGVALGKRLGCRVHGGFGLNVTNTEALLHYQALGAASMTVSFELAMAKIRALGGTIPRGAVTYGYLPLMRFRNCPVAAAAGCAQCGGAGSLTDRLHIPFPLECGQKRYSTLLNSVPLDIVERELNGLDHQLLYFTMETCEQAAAVTARCQAMLKTDGPHTGGLYYRELL